MQQKMVSKWLESIGQSKGLPLALGEDGHCTIHYGDGNECLIEVPKKDEIAPVFIYSPMLELPEQESAQLAILKATLEMNMFGLRTGSCQLSFDQRTNQVVLTFACDLETLDEEAFSQILGDFLDIASELHIKFRELGDLPVQSSNSVAPNYAIMI